MIDNKFEMHGHVIIRDDKQNVILDKDNLILRNGRKLLKDLLYNKIIGESATDKLTFYIVYGDSSSIPQADDAIDSFSNHTSITIDNNINDNDDTLSLKISFTISGSSNNDMSTFNSLGIAYRTAAESEETLISRIIFETYPINNDSSSYNIEYMLYF